MHYGCTSLYTSSRHGNAMPASWDGVIHANGASQSAENDRRREILSITINIVLSQSTMPASPLFESTSSEKPALLTISFADDPKGSLGAQLTKADTVGENDAVSLDQQNLCASLSYSEPSLSFDFNCYIHRALRMKCLHHPLPL